MNKPTTTLNDLVFDVPTFLSPASIRPLPFWGKAPRDLYARTGSVPEKLPGNRRPRIKRKWRFKQLLIPYFRQTGYTGTMEQAVEASPAADTCLSPSENKAKNKKGEKNMFDTMKVARKIREARIARDMTQMNLADAMEVSYQAVSNWERGNSMPDIAKLEQLSQILHISLEELLGMDDASHTVTRIIQKTESPEADDEPIPMEQIQEVAPLLPPSDIEKLVDDNVSGQETGEKLNLNAITGLAPFLDEEYLEELLQRAHVDSLKELAGLAPFLNEKVLDSLVRNANPETDLEGIMALAPFLGEDTLNWLVEQRTPNGSLKELAGLAPFLSEKALDSLVRASDPETDMGGILALAPFLSEDTLNWLVEQRTPNGSLKDVAGLAPFLSDKALDSLVRNASLETDLDGIMALAPFLSQKTLKMLAEQLMKGGSLNALKSIVTFL